MSSISETDCREPVGVTVGIIDAVITLCRLLRSREIDALAIREALKDLSDDEDFQWLCLQSATAGDTSPGAGLDRHDLG